MYCTNSVDDLLRTLQTVANAQQKRLVRDHLALRNSNEANFLRLVGEYLSSGDSQYRDQLADVIAKTKSSGFEEVVGIEARRTTDLSLGVALVYSLAASGTVKGREIMLSVAEDNTLTDSDRTTLATAVYTAMSEVVRPSVDGVWMLASASSKTPSNSQVEILGRLAAHFLQSRQMVEVLDLLIANAQEVSVRERLLALRR